MCRWKKLSKENSQTILFPGRALTSTTHGKYTVTPAPQIPAMPKNTELTEKSGKAEWPQQKTPPSNYLSCASTPYFTGGVEYKTKPFSNLLHQPHSKQVMEDSLLLMLVKQRIKCSLQRAPNSGCLLHYWPRPEQPFSSRTPQCAKTEHKALHEGQLRQYGLNSPVCCPCFYQALSL